MKAITNSISIFLISFLVMYCNNPKLAKTDVSQSVKALKVTATKDDLCRIVLKQQAFIDTSISRDKKGEVVTLLSDGTGLEVLYDQSVLLELYHDFGYPTEYYLSNDKKKLIYDVDFNIGNHHVSRNIFLYEMSSHKRDSLFCEDSDYVAEGYDMSISDFKINPAGDYLIVSTTDFIRCVNLKNGTWYNINGKVPFELMWKNNYSFYFNKRYNKKRECKMYDITTKKSTTILPDDTLPLQNASVTLDGDRILKTIDIYSETDTDTSGKIGDSLCFLIVISNLFPDHSFLTASIHTIK